MKFDRTFEYSCQRVGPRSLGPSRYPLRRLRRTSAAAIVERCETVLLRRFANLPPLGSSYVDPRLVDYVVPLTQRSSSRTLRTVARGSRLDLPTRRPSAYSCGGRTVDLGLISTCLLRCSARTTGTSTCSRTTTSNRGERSTADDIVDAPKGAAEFIDLDTRELVERRVRYVVATLSSYTTQPYCDLPECFAGWMARSKPGSGEVFEPRTVADRVDLTAETTNAVR